MLFSNVQVKRKDVLDHFNDYYLSALAIYNRFKRFGFPFIGGWAEQPDYIINIIEMFDVTLEKYNSYKAEQAKNKARSK